jgi:tRNA dimethylallyltransferase
VTPSAILIAGPTASGKTALAVAIAKAIGGSVINADSMQVYSDLFILSARPDAKEQAGIPHLMFGHVDGSVNYSAGKWCADAQKAIASVRDAGRVPVIAGGTGLYFKTLLHGLSDIPQVPDDVRQRVRVRAASMTGDQLHEQLAQCDPVLAQRIRPGDAQRLVRALEVFEATGKPLSSFQDNRGDAALDIGDCIAVFLAPDRALLRERINLRFDRMVEAGAVEEVRRLAASGLDPQLPLMRAHGVPGLLAYLRGETTLEAAIDRGKGDTRKYAKRQFTWFRHQLSAFEWVEPSEAEALIMRRVRSPAAGQGLAGAGR